MNGQQQQVAININSLASILASEIEAGIFEQHVVPALEVARKVAESQAEQAPPHDEEKAYKAWFCSEQGKPYKWMFDFGKAAWMARAATQPEPAIPNGAMQFTGELHKIGMKWIEYAKAQFDTNDISVAVWSAMRDALDHQPDPVNQQTLAALNNAADALERAEFFEQATAARAAIDAASAAQPVGQDGYAQGVEAAAKMLEKKADDFASEIGYDDMGGLSFGRSQKGELMRDYHSGLLELAEEVRAMNTDCQQPASAQPVAVADDCIPVPADWLQGLLLGDRTHHIELRAMLAAAQQPEGD